MKFSNLRRKCIKYKNMFCKNDEDVLVVNFLDWDTNSKMIYMLEHAARDLMKKQQRIPYSLLYRMKGSTGRYYRKTVLDIVLNLSALNANPLEFINDEQDNNETRYIRIINIIYTPSIKPYSLVFILKPCE